MNFDSSIERARALDLADPLRAFRGRFHLPAGKIYLDGNSLGLLSADAEAAVLRVLSEWKTRAIGGWMAGEPEWFTLVERLAAGLAPLVGAEPGEVTVANSTTVNLHQLLATLYRPERVDRARILAFGGEFPSDLYAIQSHLRLRGRDPARDLVLTAAGPDGLIDEAALGRQLAEDASLQVAVLPAVVYSTGQLLDVGALCAVARRAGVLIGFDLSHSIGVVAHRLTAAGADFAFWCHYKYLNAGPGAVGGLYLNARHARCGPGLAGWWGSRKDRMFDLAGEIEPALGAAGLQIGTPPILSLAALGGALAVTTEAGIDRIRAKSLQLTAYLMRLVEASLPPGEEFGLTNPRADERRGGHVAFVHAHAGRVCRALANAGVVTDFRPPNIVRFAPVPLYNSFEDCHQAVQWLGDILADRSYLEHGAERPLVP